MNKGILIILERYKKYLPSMDIELQWKYNSKTEILEIELKDETPAKFTLNGEVTYSFINRFYDTKDYKWNELALIDIIQLMIDFIIKTRIWSKEGDIKTNIK